MIWAALLEALISGSYLQLWPGCNYPGPPSMSCFCLFETHEGQATESEGSWGQGKAVSFPGSLEHKSLRRDVVSSGSPWPSRLSKTFTSSRMESSLEVLAGVRGKVQQKARHLELFRTVSSIG